MASRRLPTTSLYRACLRELPPILSRMARLSEPRKTAATTATTKTPAALHTRRLSLHNYLRLAIQTNNSGKPSQVQPEIAGMLRVQQMETKIESAGQQDVSAWILPSNRSSYPPTTATTTRPNGTDLHHTWTLNPIRIT
ncbi:uncharacterized protein DFL_007367 [Arthrobotrys flagrans]|uniref:Uncharacterized protein n=1 Tax=Arthrobotrys flagrans TaxID=97331 RepID=A0A436ZVK5_ARTFL|nr:hypothetical protein DFL_007367 [Arthrobotrys flagrans]